MNAAATGSGNGLSSLREDSPSFCRAQFEWIGRLMNDACGTAVQPEKRLLVEGRLRRRREARGIAEFAAHLELLAASNQYQEEIVPLVDAMTVNKTGYFREPAHFQFLGREAVPSLLAAGVDVERPLAVWSAACSTGEESYTLAVVLAELARGHRETPQFSIPGTDLCTEVLRKAVRAVYSAVRRLLRRLRPGGYLFTGHSGVSNGLDLPVESVAPTVCRRIA